MFDFCCYINKKLSIAFGNSNLIRHPMISLFILAKLEPNLMLTAQAGVWSLGSSGAWSVE